jgi:hypothetical protein
LPHLCLPTWVSEARRPTSPSRPPFPALHEQLLPAQVC